MDTNTQKDCSDEREIDRLLEIGKALDLDLDDVKRSGSELNFVAVRSKDLLISRRLDSRTLFIQDFRYGQDSEYGIFKGSEEALKDVGQRLFELLEIPLDEADGWQVLTEQTQTARITKDGSAKMNRAIPGAKILRVDRRLQGLPVWSSNITIRLSSQGTIAFLQAHWPEISGAVFDEACHLDYLVNHRWQPPAQEGASAESVEAGIRHSPPIAFLLDVQAAIRVIYEPWNQQYGRKLTLYFDRHGREVASVRHAERLPELVSRSRPMRDEKQDGY